MQFCINHSIKTEKTHILRPSNAPRTVPNWDTPQASMARFFAETRLVIKSGPLRTSRWQHPSGIQFPFFPKGIHAIVAHHNGGGLKFPQIKQREEISCMVVSISLGRVALRFDRWPFLLVINSGLFSFSSRLALGWLGERWFYLDKKHSRER